MRIRERCRDLFGHDGWRWRVIRTSNAYVFSDPLQRPASESENPTGTRNQGILDPVLAPAGDPNSPLERALRQLGGSIKGKMLMNGSGRPVGAT